MLHQTLTVALRPPYPLYLGEQLLDSPAVWAPHLVDAPVVIVTSPTVGMRYARTLQHTLATRTCHLIEIPDGEGNKTLATWEQLLHTLAERRLPRDTTLITLGGGTVGDLGGFAAATYQRGIRWLQCPTTLLAQVDASIGGKVAVNLPAGKNLVGQFYQPNAVVIDIGTLASLPVREYRAGLAEVVKAALIYDAEFFTWLEQHANAIMTRAPDALLNMIERACGIKAAIVAADVHEHHLRTLLNLGHTFGHALEHLTGYRHYLHGEAVAIGLVLAAQLSHRVVGFPLPEVMRIQGLLAHFQLPTQLPASCNPLALLDSMRSDKKIRQQRQRFVLLSRVGQAFVSDQVNANDVLPCLTTQHGCSLTHPECFSSVETPCTSQD